MGGNSDPSLQLTADGLDFYRRGHRFKNDTYDKDFTHLLSSHVSRKQEAGITTNAVLFNVLWAF